MTGVMAIKLVSIEVQRSGSMLRSSSCVPHGGLADTLTDIQLVQDSESSDSIAQMALQDRREDGLDRMPTQNESLTFAQLY